MASILPLERVPGFVWRFYRQSGQRRTLIADIPAVQTGMLVGIQDETGVPLFKTVAVLVRRLNGQRNPGRDRRSALGLTHSFFTWLIRSVSSRHRANAHDNTVERFRFCGWPSN